MGIKIKRGAFKEDLLLFKAPFFKLEALIVNKIGFIFDMDGVIVDSEPVYDSWNEELFKELGLEVDAQTRKSFIGVSAKRKWEILKDRFTIEQEIDDLLNMQKKSFSREWDFTNVLFPEVIPFLEKLIELKIPVAIASSSDYHRINQILSQCKLKTYFNKITSGEDFTNGKPHPDIFLRAANELGCLTENCIVVEDSFNGVTAAKKAGMYCIGVKHKDIKMDLSGADLIVDSLIEVPIDIIIAEVNKHDAKT